MIAALAFAVAAMPSKWTPMFNGKDLSGWTPKFRGCPLGENYKNTFRVEDGCIQVRYDEYESFDNRFGHLHFEKELSAFAIRLEYRFIGEQAKDGPGWAWRNSGLMVLGQDPKSMGQDQDFPNSAEFQFLGGDKEGERHTGNLCTPGTNVVMGGELVTRHCTDSTSPTFRGDQWVRAEIEVHTDGTVVHKINGEEVLRYSGVQYELDEASKKLLSDPNDIFIRSGWVSLQAESHPVEFRNIEYRELSD